MREILFRGKRMDNGEWAVGYLYEHEPALVGIVSENDAPEPSKWFIARTGFADWNMPRPVELVEVDPSTVGQYTGLKDKNGERIFDGDIVQAHFKTNHSKQIFRVAFDYGTFIFNNGYVKVPVRGIYRIKVIGNIHDNPEFMKEGANNG